jgi:hypothetical protein
MKKGLLLSIVASTMIFAGGDIAPVEPAAAAPAADCSDFYGQVGMYYQSEAKGEDQDVFSDDATNNFSLTATIGVEKSIMGGLGFAAEVSGWSTVGLEAGGSLNEDGSGHIDGARVGDSEGGALTQLYLTGSFNNTAIKAGRFALPASLSPLTWTDSTAGVKEYTFEGVLVANTDLADTTVYGVYAKNTMNKNSRTVIGQDDLGLFALGFVNKSVENTKITAVGYYVPDAITADDAVYAAFATVNTKMADYKLDVQAGYVGGDTGASTIFKLNAGDDATFAVGARISGTFGAVSASLAGSYVNDGDFKLGPVGGYWLYTAGEENYRLNGLATTAVQAKVSTKLGMGKVYGRVAYYKSSDGAGAQIEDTLAARVGYKFKVAGISTKIEYRYRNQTAYDDGESKRQRVRIESTYKF